jgi:photosystem II stability/assembly factor-like uncharacterized protein
VLAALATTVALSAAPAATAAAPKPVRAQVRVTPQPDAPVELFGMSFADSQNGHAAGTNGVILRTTDGGATWTPENPPVKTIAEGQKETLLGISFPDPLHGHAVGADGTILATDDGGATWRVQQPPPGGIDVAGVTTGWAFRSVSFSDPNRGMIVGGAAILSTQDGGASWSAFGNPRFGSLRDVSLVDGQHAQIVSRAGQENGIPFVTIASEDGGRSWTPRAADLGPGIDTLNFSGVSFTDPLHGHAVGDEGRIVATTDGGLTWRLQRANGVETLTGVAFADERRGLAVGTVTFLNSQQRAIILATDDGGNTWVSRLVPDTVRLRGGVDFAGADTAYAVGCRQDDPTALSRLDNTCAAGHGAIIRIDFLPPAAAAGAAHTSSSGLILAGAGVVLALAIGLVAVRRRRGRA